MPDADDFSEVITLALFIIGIFSSNLTLVLVGIVGWVVVSYLIERGNR